MRLTDKLKDAADAVLFLAGFLMMAGGILGFVVIEAWGIWMQDKTAMLLGGLAAVTIAGAGLMLVNHVGAKYDK